MSTNNKNIKAHPNRLYETAILAEQTAQIFAGTNSAILATVINASILVLVLWPVVDQNNLILWLAAVVIINAGRIVLAHRYKSSNPGPDQTKSWSRRFLLGNLPAAMIWGAAAVWLFPDDDAARQLYLAFAIGGMAAAAVAYLSYIKAVIYSYLAFTLAPLSFQFLFSDTELGVVMGGMIWLYLFMLVLAARRSHSTIQQNARLVIENSEREHSLEQSQQRYKSLLETATDAFFLHDLDGKILDVNQQACRNLGYSRQELLALSVNDVETGANAEELKRKWPNLQQGETIHLEGRHQRKDGSTFPIEASLGMVQIDDQPLLSVLARDITARKQAEQELLTSQQRMALHVQRTPLGVIEWDRERCVKEWNPAAERIFGFSKEEATGQHAKTLIIAPSATENVDLVWDELLTLRGGLRNTNKNITKTGEKILCEWYNTPLINEAGEVFGVASLVQDITQQKNAEAELIKAKEEAESANQAKSEFLSSMSHELRTPLNAILGFSQLLELDDRVPTEQQDNAKQILQAGDHLLNLINEVLDLAKVESGHIDLTLEPVALQPVLQECLSLVEALAYKHDVRLDLSDIQTAAVCADKTRLKQVILNLLSNAIKYNYKGGKVILELQKKSPALIRIQVSDTGPGIPTERQTELFQPFNRLDAENSNIEGTGIGLTLTQCIVEKMGGKVGVKSTVGKGSRFWIDLPSAALSDVQKEEPVEVLDITQNNVKPSTEHTVLYIEDNPINLKLVQQIIEKHTAYTLLSATNAELGVSLAKSHKPDLILMDINLPGIDGFEAMAQLQKMDTTRAIPVIAISANAMPSDIARAKSAGFHDYMIKPIDIMSLRNNIEALLCE